MHRMHRCQLPVNSARSSSSASTGPIDGTLPSRSRQADASGWHLDLSGAEPARGGPYHSRAWTMTFRWH
jgi:hypothetical protein